MSGHHPVIRDESDGTACLNDICSQSRNISSLRCLDHPYHSSSWMGNDWSSQQLECRWYDGYSEGYFSCSNMEADHELARYYDGDVMDTVPYGCCVDKYYCSRALTLGYDSIQIVDRQEIVICIASMVLVPLSDCVTVHILQMRKIHGVKPSGHAAVAHDDDNGSSYRYEDCHFINICD